MITHTKIEPAEPCMFCWSPTFWRSAYGGPLMCAVCDPWPARAMVGERRTIWRNPDGTLRWIPCLRAGERAGDVAEEPVADEPGIRTSEVADEDGTWLRLELGEEVIQ